MKQRILFFSVFMSVLVSTLLYSQTTGQLLNLNIQATSLEGNLLETSTTQPIAVYLPPSYESSNKSYPVVYFLGGYGDRVTDWTNGTYQGFRIKNIMDKLIGNKTINEFIVVIVAGYNFLAGSFYVNSPVSGNWEDFVVKDVIGYIDANYRTIKNRDSRGISGHSMGGFGTINLAMLHPDIFGAIYALSPGLYSENGLQTSQIFKSNAFINQFIQKEQELSGLSSTDAMNSYKSYISSRFNSGDWDTPFAFAYGSAFSPDTNKSVPYIDYPYSKSGDLLVVDSLKLKKYESGFGNQAEKVKKYKENFLNLRLLAYEVGIYDEYSWLRNGCDYFDQLLTTENIPHQFTKFNGSHQDKVGERFEKYLLPSLSNSLVYDTTTTGIKTGSDLKPDYFELKNFPNPFNPSTLFHFNLPNTGQVKMVIYNLLGEKVINLLNEIKQPGNYNIKWEASEFPSGVYICRLESGRYSDQVKVILQK